jgi:hypothetical protein
MRDHNLMDGYDWVLHTDDDTYMVMENLQAYLASDEIASKMYMRPMQVGSSCNINSARDMVPEELQPIWSELNGNLDDQFWFAHGGSGFAMNQIYLRNIFSILDTKKCLNDSFVRYWEDWTMCHCPSVVPTFKMEVPTLPPGTKWDGRGST